MKTGLYSNSPTGTDTLTLGSSLYTLSCGGGPNPSSKHPTLHLEVDLPGGWYLKT